MSSSPKYAQTRQPASCSVRSLQPVAPPGGSAGQTSRPSHDVRPWVGIPMMSHVEPALSLIESDCSASQCAKKLDWNAFTRPCSRDKNKEKNTKFHCVCLTRGLMRSQIIPKCCVDDRAAHPPTITFILTFFFISCVSSLCFSGLH